MAIEKSFNWLDVEKFQADPIAMLKDLGLESFPYLAVMVETSIFAINMDRDRRSIIGSNAPYLGNSINNIDNLRSLISSLTKTLEQFQLTVLHAIWSTRKELKQFSLTDFISQSSPEILANDAHIEWAWNLDIGDLLAVQVLVHLDKAHAAILAGNLDAALQLYAIAKQYHEQLVVEIVNPKMNWLRVAKSMGKKVVINRRATAGGLALQERTQLEREAIRPFVQQILNQAKPHERKTRNAAFVYLFPALRAKLNATPPSGMPSDYVMSEAAFKSAVKDFFNPEDPVS
jgi:hypothetical protein